MKKDYLKPETVEVGISCEIIMQNSSIIEVKPGESGPAAADKSRGEWGNVWGK